MNLRTQLDFFHDAGPDVPALVAAGALFVVNHSGGKDSQAMLIRLIEQVPASNLLVVHASLGEVEWPGALELAQQQAEAAGLPFIVARAGKTFLELVQHRFERYPHAPSFPQAGNRQCTSDLKRGPIEREIRRYAKANGFTTIITCMGLRASESAGRAKALPWRLNQSGSVAGRTWYEWLPIHTLFTSEVFAIIREAGQVPHHAYALGNERLSCCFCIMASQNDLRNAALHRPELYAKYVALEESTGYTMHMSRKSLPELTGLSVRQAQRLHELNTP
ncbi:phosphoadenosine phosphosulfate reductase family protein [Hymenobacter sp. YC55]|uniref:phosphoadenosine phosphosulfate reductase domain-containing protein n=1 Tax=Hymenobacter sp. YC55 TaxID=3034019 RepID=UPI0023F8423B|nr:phosphoadenosine phosphosulfate reductase family protein [Hymenobacter sp. YC55]MDF7810778.1 phosphoadenosine phosphosulfate reductase family protein [Hymenobacter sp. YC55]